ncbi:MAG: replication initiator protein [Microviridae sp.]|nr:MAG: replication initiator protein [Microviridae sp.]
MPTCSHLCYVTPSRLYPTSRRCLYGSTPQNDLFRLSEKLRAVLWDPPEKHERIAHAWGYPPLMTCFRPYSVRHAVKGGITFRLNEAFTDRPSFNIPCGQCIGCRLERSQSWATRLRHEAQYHEATSFLTLTYDDAHLPDDYSVSTRELQLFNKRLRKAIGPFRFFACGEYGEKNLRPHYHMILFGHDFALTRTPWRKTASGFITYRSHLLEKLWTLGHSEIGTVTTASAGYVARYCLKKVGGDLAKEHYSRVHPITGQIVQVAPEFITMSNKPGIGSAWIEEFKSDVYPSDFVTLDGAKRPVPRYYAKRLTEMEQQLLKHERKMEAAKHAANNSDARLDTREQVQQSRLDRLTRELDETQ